MFRQIQLKMLATIAFLSTCATAYAQPKMVNIGISVSDMTADGQTVVGLIYDRPIDEDAVIRYTRGGGFERIPGAVVGGNEVLRCSDDATALSLHMDNIDDWGELNCFDSNTDPPYTEPCPIPAISHHWTAESGWVNCGSFPYNEVVENYVCGTGDPVPTTVRVGGTRCDFTINTPNDISGDGRYVIGAGWFATSDPRSNGCPPFGFCGDFFSFRWDSMTGNLEMLPVQPGTDTARADRTNFDGNVIIGYDLGFSPDPDGIGPLSSYSGRRLSVWRGTQQTLLDEYGHRSAAVNRDGTMVVSQTSQTLTNLLYGPPMNTEDQLFYTRLVRWTWDGIDWIPEDLGKPALYQGFPAIQIIPTSISDDGNTVVGIVGYGVQDFGPALTFRMFIWRPTLNGGVPMDLQEYLRSQVPMGETTYNEDKIWLNDVRHLSGDGNSMIVSFLKFADASSCLPTFHNAILYLDGTTCEPPVVELDSYAIVRDEETPLNSDVINCRAIGTWPLNYQWQRKDILTGEWVDLIDDFDPDCSRGFGEYTYQGTSTAQLRLGLDPFYTNFACEFNAGDYRCIVSNECGSATTDPAHVTITSNAFPSDCFNEQGDMNTDFLINVGDIPNFVAALLCKPMPDFQAADRADMNLDGRKDGLDIQVFIEALMNP